MVKSAAPVSKKGIGKRVFSIIQAAGWPIWPLLLTSVIAVALIIERSFTLRRSNILPPTLLEQVPAPGVRTTGRAPGD
jgi:biopolymer transport protein ExbB/TolQ